MLAGVSIGLRVIQVSSPTCLPHSISKQTSSNPPPQILFAITILGLYITLAKGQIYDSIPVTTRYNSFTGGFGIIVGALGLAGLFIDAISDLIIIAVDAVAGILLLAGGIAWAVGIKGISCGDPASYPSMLENGLLNQGKMGEYYGVFQLDGVDTGEAAFYKLKATCEKGFAAEIIQFLSFGILISLVGVGYIRMRSGGKSGAGRYVA